MGAVFSRLYGNVLENKDPNFSNRQRLEAKVRRLINTEPDIDQTIPLKMERTMSDLPKEVLFDIFEKITEADDRRTLALVCKCFYEIVRRQSANYSKISIGRPVHDILAIFANCPIFPFRTLHLTKSSDPDFTQNQENWIFAGQTIKILIMDSKIYHLPHFLHAVKAFFPKLEELQIRDYRNAGAESLQNPEEYRNESLAILQVADGAEFSIHQVNFFLRCYPNLKILEIFIRPEVLETPEFAEIVSNWCSQVTERVILDIYEDRTQYPITLPKLSTIARLQETKKLHFRYLEISMRDEDIKTFFSCPRNIYGLILHHCKDSTVEKLHLIATNATVSYLDIKGGFPNFEEAGGLFASFQNLKIIGIAYNSHFFNVHAPSAVFLSKVDSLMRDTGVDQDEDIDGYMWQISPNFVFWVQHAHNLETLYLPDKATDEVLQVIIRNCPKLKVFETNISWFTEDGLLGTVEGDSLCISELKKLETLNLEMPNSFTDRTLIKAIRFPKLKFLLLSGGKNLSLVGLQALANNCPKLEMIRFEKCSFVPNCCLNRLPDIFKSADKIKIKYCFIGELQFERVSLNRKDDYDDFDEME